MSEKSSSKLSLSSFSYRTGALVDAGIHVSVVWDKLPASLRQVVASLLDFKETVPENTTLSQRYRLVNQGYRILSQPQDAIKNAIENAIEADYQLAEAVSRAALENLNMSEARWTDVINIALSALMLDEELDFVKSLPWIPQHPLPAAAGLSTPKPNFAFGFKELAPERADVRQAPVWSRAFIRALKAQRGLYLTPHVAESQDRLLYPFFVFEAKNALGSTYAAVNHLGGSLSYALGRLRQLRTDALHPEHTDQLYVFGATSSGNDWQLYLAHEVDPAEPEMSCGLVLFWSGNIGDLGAALEFVLIVRRLKEWAHLTLKPQLSEWLESLRPQ